MVKRRKEDYTSDVIDQLGARYRYYLNGTLDDKKLVLTLRLTDEAGQVIKDKRGNEAYWDIKPCELRYMNSLPNINKKKLTGKRGDWVAFLTVGFAPDTSEYAACGQKVPSGRHPYHRWKKRFDIVMHNRVITHATSEDLGVESYHNLFAPIRGEILLISGFNSSITKDGVENNANFHELKERIAERVRPILNKYLTRNGVSGMSEGEYRDKVALSEEKVRDAKVYKEYTIEGCACRADLVVNGEIWELKTAQADALDVYQLLCYIEMAKDPLIKKKSGRLICPSFGTGSKYAIEHVKKQHGIDIKMITFGDMLLPEPFGTENKVNVAGSH